VTPSKGWRSYEIASSGDALPVIQLARKADTKAVWICDYEIPETVIPVGNWNDDLCADFIYPRPILVYVGNHHSDVGTRKLWNRGRLYGINSVESRRLGEKEAMIFPSHLHKIAPITKERESQETVETNGPLYVSDDDLGYELLCRINVLAHDCTRLESGALGRKL
jgi:hypothetical protein